MTSFITAFKNGGSASTMAPAPGTSGPIGAMWYRPVLKSCPGDKPQNWESALDSVNYAVVMPAGSSGTIRVTSNGQVLSQDPVVPGLNYAAVESMQLGAQSVELLDPNGSVVMIANSQYDVQNEYNGTCNFNYYVVGLQQQNLDSADTPNTNASATGTYATIASRQHNGGHRHLPGHL